MNASIARRITRLRLHAGRIAQWISLPFSWQGTTVKSFSAMRTSSPTEISSGGRASRTPPDRPLNASTKPF